MKTPWHIQQNFFSKKEIKEINKIVNNKSDDSLGDNPADTIKTCDVKILHAKYLKPFINKIDDRVNEINTFNFGFILHPSVDRDWIYHNTYKAENSSEYNWHVDLQPLDSYDLKFTALVNVSEKEYSGGDFYLHLHQILKFEGFNQPGSLIVFPSFILHKVEPIIKGERKTLVHWRKGPTWQ
jgi:PKHD-type hydroxylase